MVFVKNINKDYVVLYQLVLIEEFKNCLPTELKPYVDEQKVKSVHQAAMLGDDYALTHTPVFRHPRDPQSHKGNSQVMARILLAPLMIYLLGGAHDSQVLLLGILAQN